MVVVAEGEALADVEAVAEGEALADAEALAEGKELAHAEGLAIILSSIICPLGIMC